MVSTRTFPANAAGRMRRRWFAALGLVVAVPLGLAAGVPRAWLSYANIVSRELQLWLAAAEPPAQRLHTFLEHRVAADGEPDQGMTVRLWIDDDGNVTRVEFDSLGDAQADEDLRQTLRRRLIAPPPHGMRQPLILRLTLKPARQPDTPAAPDP